MNVLSHLIGFAFITLYLLLIYAMARFAYYYLSTACYAGKVDWDAMAWGIAFSCIVILLVVPILTTLVSPEETSSFGRMLLRFIQDNYEGNPP